MEIEFGDQSVSVESDGWDRYNVVVTESTGRFAIATGLSFSELKQLHTGLTLFMTNAIYEEINNG